MKKKSFMRRVWEFIRTFIIPRKMEIHRDMNIFVAFLIFLVCAIICAGIPSVRLKKVVKNRYVSDCYIYGGSYEAQHTAGCIECLPTFELDANNSATKITDSTYQVYDFSYVTEENETINLKIVYDFSKGREDALEFDLNAYLSDVPFDGNKQLKSKDILVIYTDNILYYIYNHGYNDAYSKSNEDAKLEDYFYLHVAKWAETGKWSEFEGEFDENGKFTPYLYFPTEEQVDLPSSKWTTAEVATYVDGKITNESKTINGKEYKGVKHYTNQINRIFTYEANTNMGIYSYLELEQTKATYNHLDNPLVNFSDILLNASVTSVRVYSYILAMFYVVLLPIMWVLIMWLILRKNGELQRLREYYTVAAATMILPSIITAIVGLFVPYTLISRFAMIVQAVWYFVVCSMINTQKKPTLKQEEVIDTTVEVQPSVYTIDTTPVSEYKAEENSENPEGERRKPSQIE